MNQKPFISQISSIGMCIVAKQKNYLKDPFGDKVIFYF